MSNKGLIFILSSPSGGGKTSIVRKIVCKDQNIKYITSATTRQKRHGEKENQDYIFLSKDLFELWEKDGKFIETTVYHYQKYGTPKEPLYIYINKGEDVLLDIDVIGGQNLKNIFPDAILIFIIPPSREELARRLKERGRELDVEIDKRLEHAEKEILSARNYDYLVINDDFDSAVEKVQAIITAERCRRERTLDKIWLKGG